MNFHLSWKAFSPRPLDTHLNLHHHFTWEATAVEVILHLFFILLDDSGHENKRWLRREEGGKSFRYIYSLHTDIQHLKIKGWRTSFEARNSAEQTTICGFFFISSLNSSVWCWRQEFRCRKHSWTGFVDLEMLNNLPPNHNPDAQSVTFALDLLGNWGQWYNQQNSRTWRMHCTCML